MVSRRIALLVVLVIGMLGGCTPSPDTSGPLPEGRGLVDESATALRDLRSVHFQVSLSGTVPGLSIREVDGVATRQGGEYGFASGDADVQEHTDRVQYRFLLSGDRLRLTDKDGNSSERSVPAEFSPARLLDPEQGLYQLLEKASGLTTEGREELDGVSSYRVTGEVSRSVVSAIVPGIEADVDVKFWVREGKNRDLLRLWMQIPPRQKNEGSVMLEVALSEHNAPVRESSDSS
ncbi:LppX_LprAFG lipoprotein [Saccharomonospora sp. NPDC006951]